MTPRESITATVRARHWRWKSEADLQALLWAAFVEDGVSVLREHGLGAGADRPDFFDPVSGLAVEVKIKGEVAAVMRQLWRYAACVEVREVLLITSVARHVSSMPPMLCDKPLHVVRPGGFL